MEGCHGCSPTPQAWQAEQDEVLAAPYPCLGGEACSACAQAFPYCRVALLAASLQIATALPPPLTLSEGASFGDSCTPCYTPCSARVCFLWVQARGGEVSVLPGTEGDEPAARKQAANAGSSPGQAADAAARKQTANAGSSPGQAADAGGAAASCKASESTAAALSLGVDSSHASILQAQLEAQQCALAATRATADAQLQQVGSSISTANCSPSSESMSACCV